MASFTPHPMAKSKHTPVRSPDEDTITFNLPKRLKRSIYGRAKLVDRRVSPILRAAMEFHEKTGWKHVAVNDMPVAVLTPKAEARLQEWVDSGEEIEQL